MMFRGDGQSVEENQEDDQPIENLWFDRCPALPPTQPVPPPRVSTEEEEAVCERERWRGEEKMGERWGKRERERREGQSQRVRSREAGKGEKKEEAQGPKREEIRKNEEWSTETSEKESEREKKKRESISLSTE